MLLSAIWMAASLTACKPALTEPEAARSTPPTPTTAAAEPIAAAEPTPASKAASKPEPSDNVAATKGENNRVLIFRNTRSWRRKFDFEEALGELKVKFEVRPSIAISSTELNGKRLIIIPGAQWSQNFYADYASNQGRFDDYVKGGGVLLLELNGAEDSDVALPGGVKMKKHGAIDNAVLIPDHPALSVFPHAKIHANFASHGYLEGLPESAMILASEFAVDDQPDENRPTFAEYSHGSGRVLAACQCFHDQDGSGRQPLMAASILYAQSRKWHAPKK